MRFVPNSGEEGGGGGAMPVARSAPPRRGGLILLLAVGSLIVASVIALRVLRPPDSAARIEAQANAYVTLALALGRVEPGTIDGYFGPAALAPRADRPAPSLADIRARGVRLLKEIDGDRGATVAPRRAALAGDVRQLITLIDAMQANSSPRFDEEARQLYGIDVGVIDDRQRRAALIELAALLPGADALPIRVATFRARLAIPEAARAAVFARALAECRRRTLAHWPLPPRERVEVRWSPSVPAAWHRYRGDDLSLLEINPAAVAFVGAAIDTACHEAYPGHHAQFVAMDIAAGAAGSPVEQRIVLLRSPQAVLREGAANYGVRLAFPLTERSAFARDVLYPLAGLPPRDADLDMRVHQLLGDLETSTVPILRAYRDGKLPFDAATTALRDEAMVASPEALLQFVDQYGALVIGYTIARDRVARQVAARSARSHRDAWAELREIVAGSDISALTPVAKSVSATS